MRTDEILDQIGEALDDWQRAWLTELLPAVPVTRFRRRNRSTGPDPLPIDGRAYHQRQRNRRRR